MISLDRDAGRKFESGSSKRKGAIERKQVQENLHGSLYKYIKSDDQETYRSPVPPSTLSSQEHESDSMSTSMNAGMENLKPQNDPGLWPITITDVDRTDIVESSNPD